MNALVPIQQSNVDAYRASTDAATLCKEIVVSTAKKLGDRNYVCVEGWQAIAIAHGCTASARDVERVEGGIRAIGEVRRMSDGAVIAEAEGFVGEDEPLWYGGTMRSWKWGEKRGEKVWYDKQLPKRADYAIRAMAQTRAISRACRSAFAHVVVMMNAGLSTTPAEEVPQGGFDNAQEADYSEAPPQQQRKQEPAKQRAAQGQGGVQLITPEQELMLDDKMREAGVDPVKFLREGAGISKSRDLPANKFGDAMKALTGIIAGAQKHRAAQGPSEGEFSEIGDDCVPY
ncbi:hypothetical protein [Sphingobium yanoikuyae]|uniref:hypothetical protein n=1 Tax=Sphingobium yanoikuyae TaxID=13690 RepID=UPI0026F2A6FF|nr:hypothetical protein [Sphingobium yanoikuyae]